jgi:hypothetical protein
VTPETTCPVCDFRQVSLEASRCPQCDADLKCYEIIDALPDELVVNAPDARGTGRISPKPVLLIGIAGVAICLLCAGFFFFFASFKQLQSQLETQRARIREIELALSEPRHASVEEASGPKPAAPESNREAAGAAAPPAVPSAGNLPSARPPLPSVEGPASDLQADEEDFFVYHLQSGDRLWTLAKKFYRNGDLYPLLLLHNPHLEIYGTKAGAEVKILEDRKKAQAIFDRIAERDHGEIYYWCTLSEADTLASLTARFYGPYASPERITDLNPGVAIEAGNRIRIVAE